MKDLAIQSILTCFYMVYSIDFLVIVMIITMVSGSSLAEAICGKWHTHTHIRI